MYITLLLPVECDGRRKFETLQHDASDGGARGIFRTGGTEVQLGRVFDFRLALPSLPPPSIRGKSIYPVISSYITRSR